MTTSCSCGCQHDAQTSSAMQILMDEHRLIEKVLDSVERMCERPGIDRAFFTSALDFFRSFADGCHHHKEEDELFPALETAGVPRDGGPIGCMLHEHQEGRRMLRRIDEHLVAASQGYHGDIEAVRAAAGDYIRMLRFHIQKEDNVLFPMADQVLDSEAKKRMTAAFDCSASADQERQRHAHYLQLAEQLHERAFAEVSAATW